VRKSGRRVRPRPPDEIHRRSDRTRPDGRRLAREERHDRRRASGGMAVVAARGAGPKGFGPDAVVVAACCPTRAADYLSKIFNDEWMADYTAFLEQRGRSATSPSPSPAKQGHMPAGAVHPEGDGRRLVAIRREFGRESDALVQARGRAPERQAAEAWSRGIAGAHLLDGVASGRARRGGRVGGVHSPPSAVDSGLGRVDFTPPRRSDRHRRPRDARVGARKQQGWS